MIGSHRDDLSLKQISQYLWQKDRGQKSALLRFISFQGYLSLGIASLERPSGANYLMKATQSLIDNMSEEDEKNAIIVIFLADIEESPKSRTKGLFIWRRASPVSGLAR